MKWNTVIGSLMLGACLSAPSFGQGLLDRMLGLKGAGCDSACCDTGCVADPTCGVEVCDPCGAPTCGVEVCDPCGAPTCGVEVCDPCGAPTCGVETYDACCDSGCARPRRKPLLELFSRLRCQKDKFVNRLCSTGCDSGCASVCEPTCGIADPCYEPSCGIADPCCEPSCGVAAGCDSGCGCRSGGGLLARLFKKRNNSCCDAIACDSCCTTGYSHGSSAPVQAPEANGDAAPMPPAPEVDPSAYLQSNRRVIQATSYVR